jgi:formylmethanofuran--tetrahydromethanopterin N-formyltransferase
LIVPTTNELYCPSLKGRLGRRSRVPEDVNYIPEIVINGIDLPTVARAMKVGIESVWDFSEVMKISAGNFEGKLGRYRIDLKGLFC